MSLLEHVRQALAGNKARYDRGQTNLVGLLIGVLIASIVGIAVFIPTVSDVISSANLSGTTLTVVNQLPLFAGLMLLIAMAAPLMTRL